ERTRAMSENPLPDPLETFLREPPSQPPPAEFEAALRLHTAELVQRPRPWRRWPLLAAVAAAIALVYFVIRSGHVHRPEVPGPPVVAEKTPVPERQPETPAPFVETKVISPLAIEWLAFDAPDDRQRVRQYFRAGDLYLTQSNDVESALR